MKRKLSYVALMAGLLAVAGCSNDQSSADSNSEGVTTLRFSHFMTPNDPINKEVFEPWAKKVEEDSKGRLKVEIYPSATLSKPDSTYESSVSGIVDIGVQPQGYTSGRFPISLMAELPGISTSGEQLGCVMHKLYDDGVIADEYKDTHVLFMLGSGSHSLHTKDKTIKTPADLQGMRIRRTSSVTADLLDALGAVPVGIPAMDTYTSLQRGVIDGVSLPWQPMAAFRLNELVNTHTVLPYYNAEFVISMNKDKYNSLPDDLKKVIDDNSGAQMGIKGSKIFDRINEEVMKEAAARGDTIIEIKDPLNDPAWKPALEKGTQKYLDNLKAQGIDADALYEKVKAASVSCQG
ncbi:TRAP transporter substrate-binding protein [Neisseria montereyensis]|uniref:TRAP transporter substrate-binding protein n=1 Tax=Neisseria montereyensis TaxID=2973938 RepID=A0ABT2FAK4_9NEIS|nr:TRAP transporter substrate-binding protein [Neisseria montereyensis]MCS4533254.1 TRAP transporter substrate-binding protein [Neisseria montereyensis]